MNKKYINIGYDIRKLAEDDFFMSADINIWEQDNILYSKAKLIDGIEENIFQLLNPLSDFSLNELCFLVKSDKKKSVLILLSVEEDVYRKSIGTASEFEEVITNNVSLSFIGFDVCDINGFFSVFDMRKAYFQRDKLLNENEVEISKEIIEISNNLIPSHAPFYLVMVSKVDLNKE